MKCSFSYSRVGCAVCGVMLATLMGLAAFAQDFKPATSSNAKQFLGTWQGSFEGKPFVTLKLSMNGGKLTGTGSHASIELNQKGELTKAEEKEGEDLITDALVNGDNLRITTKSTDGSEDTMQSELKLLGPDEAELRMLGVPPDVPAPKPWKLKRLATKPQ